MQQMYNPRSVERRHLAQTAIKLLDVLPWKGRKLGLSNDDKNHDLWRYLGNEWFRSADEDDMLDLLRHQITSDSEKMARGFRVENVNLTDKLLKLSEVGGTTYGTSQGWRWIRKQPGSLDDMSLGSR